MDRPELRLSGALGLSESSGFGCRTGGLSGKGVVATRVFTGRRGSGARRERGGVAATSRSAFKSRGGHDVILGVRPGAAAAADPARRGTQPRSAHSPPTFAHSSPRTRYPRARARGWLRSCSVPFLRFFPALRCSDPPPAPPRPVVGPAARSEHRREGKKRRATGGYLGLRRPASATPLSPTVAGKILFDDPDKEQRGRSHSAPAARCSRGLQPACFRSSPQPMATPWQLLGDAPPRGCRRECVALGFVKCQIAPVTLVCLGTRSAFPHQSL